nr:hypothetical protein [Candidatus Njordarchaeum guaymaensis]
MNDENKLYWLKALLAIVAALVCSAAVAPLGKYGIAIALLIYLATYPVAVFVLKIDPSKSGGVRKMLLSGLITFLFIFSVIWGLIFTLEYYLLIV